MEGKRREMKMTEMNNKGDLKGTVVQIVEDVFHFFGIAHGEVGPTMDPLEVVLPFAHPPPTRVTHLADVL
jgi:hypothetical protein